MKLLPIAVVTCSAVAVAWSAWTTTACPFCDAPSLLMAEQLQQSDHLLLGKWVGGDKATETKAGTAKFTILKVAKSAGERFKVGETIELPQYLPGSETSNYALMGPDARLVDWQIPSEVSDAAWKYLSELPPPVTDPAKQTERLAFAIEYLEHPDLIVANDAFSEFAAAPYEVIVPLRDRLPREKLRALVMDPKTSVTRIGLYGLLLGLCGKDEDASAMEQKILAANSEFRLGLDGVMAGYLLIRGEAGLRVLEESKMRKTTRIDADGKEVSVPFSEIYATMQALRFLWTYEPDRIPKDRLKLSMQLLLENPQLSDLVIADLSRWKDWSIQDRLMTMYSDEKYNIPAVKRAIVRYLYYCSQDKSATATPVEGDSEAAVPEHVTQALANLAKLEETDPKTVGDAKRYLIR